MSGQQPEIVIVRRRSALEDTHHGGAWKIAFADFMTAMMAFFLVLWIISATDKNTKTIIARYFNPVKVEEPARAQKGIHGAPDPDVKTGQELLRAANAEKSGGDQREAAGKSASEALEATPGDAKSSHQAKVVQPDPARPTPTMSEEELFSDPRASLDKISGTSPPGPRVDPAPRRRRVSATWARAPTIRIAIRSVRLAATARPKLRRPTGARRRTRRARSRGRRRPRRRQAPARKTLRSATRRRRKIFSNAR